MFAIKFLLVFGNKFNEFPIFAIKFFINMSNFTIFFASLSILNYKKNTKFF